MTQGERANRWLYAIEAVLIGLPTLTASIPLLFLGFVAVILGVSDIVTQDVGHDWIAVVLMAVLVVAGWAGLTSWTVLSGHYVSGGRKALQQTERHWWVSLGFGCAAAVTVMALRISQDGADVLWGPSWLMGPALILPAVHLATGQPVPRPRHRAEPG